MTYQTDTSPSPTVKTGKAANRSSLVSSLFFSVLFGFAAGAVGMMFVATYFLPTPDPAGGGAFTLNRSRATRATDEYGKVPSPVETAARSVAFFYHAKPSGQTLLDQVYLPQEALGAGVVLTSDGWLISSAGAVFSDKGAGGTVANLVAVVGTKTYAVQRVVRDDFSATVFVKVDAQNLPVIVFGDNTVLEPGDTLFGFDALRGPHRLDFVGFGRRLPANAGDYVVSSERRQTVMRLSAAPEVLAGSVLVDGRGAVVGIFAGNDAVGSVGMPFKAVDDQLSTVLRGKNPSRSFLGVNYVDLTQVVSGKASRLSVGRGASLSASPDGRRPAVARRSPAAEAGLKEGDLILAVGDEELSALRPLADVIADYEPKTKVTLTVRRATGVEPAADVPVEVTLGEAAVTP